MQILSGPISIHPKSVLSEVKAAGLGNLIQYLDVLYAQAFFANCEYGILHALDEASDKYQKQLECAGCFFSVSRMALQESLFMNCARLYDKKGEVSLYGLLDCCRELEQKISGRAVELYSKRPGFDPARPVRHFLKDSEERFYRDEVRSQRAFDFLADGAWKFPAELRLSVNELLDLFGKRMNGMSKTTDMLREQRNRIYAHSGMESLNYDAFAEENGLTIGQVADLISCALDITGEIYALITGICRPPEAGNVNDIEGLLRLTKLGWDTVNKHAVGE